jgi:hypothetical protein
MRVHMEARIGTRATNCTKQLSQRGGKERQYTQVYRWQKFGIFEKQEDGLELKYSEWELKMYLERWAGPNHAVLILVCVFKVAFLLLRGIWT